MQAISGHHARYTIVSVRTKKVSSANSLAVMKSVNPHGISTANLNVAILHHTRLDITQVEKIHQSAATSLLASRVEVLSETSWQVQSSQQQRVWYRIILWRSSHPTDNPHGMLLTCTCDYSAERICHHRYAVILSAGQNLNHAFIESLPRPLRSSPPVMPLLRPTYCAKRGRKKNQRVRPTKSGRQLSPQRDASAATDEAHSDDSASVASSSPLSPSSSSSRPTWSPFSMDGSTSASCWFHS